jgi:cyclophilin family peptidyl-prolyl cis-trans isomerase
MRLRLFVALLALPAAVAAQARTLSAADSALIGRILLAEDRRDSLDAAMIEGWGHADARVRALVQRGTGRIRDARFAARDSLPALPAPVAWPEPAWRLRYRALTERRNDCDALLLALADSSWHVRLRAADLSAPQCASSNEIATILRDWVDRVRSNAAYRTAGGVSWHAGAHALVALAALRPDDARQRVRRFAGNYPWQVRLYAARAAALLSDTMTLRKLIRDNDDNVREAAIVGLSRVTGHADDSLFLGALESKGAQAVRAAAIALKDSPQEDVRAAASAAFERWAARAHASERDARVALLEAAGRPATDDRPPAVRSELPPRAVALALGEDVRLRVTMAEGSGGGAFVIRMRGDVAPMMAARVLQLAKAGYYNRSGWHRVDPDFVIQGGGPGANEYVGHASFFRDELGTVPHARGTVGMSTRGHDTGDAQWFVNLKDNLRLGRDYTVFAEVVEGMEVVDGVLEGDMIEKIEEVRVPRR